MRASVPWRALPGLRFIKFKLQLRDGTRCPPFPLVSKVICSLTKGLSGQATFWAILDPTCLKSAEWAGTESCQPFFSTDPDTFGFVWFGLCSLGEENAWQHWPFKASSAAPRRVLGAGKDSTGTAGKFVSAAQWGAVDFRQWPAASLLYVGDRDAGPTLNSQCTHPMKAERWGSRGSRMLRGVFLETQSLEVSLK